MAALGAILGGLLGLVQGFVAWRAQTQVTQTHTPWIPQTLIGMPDLYRAFQVLGSAPKCDVQQLARVARRCDTLFKLEERVARADPRTVKPSLGPAAARLKNEGIELLNDFYHGSRISMVASEGEIVPVNTALRDAHNTIVRALQDETHNVGLIVAESQREKAAVRQAMYLERADRRVELAEADDFRRLDAMQENGV
jgi:hypothetical protein